MNTGKVSYKESVGGWMYSAAEDSARKCRCCGVTLGVKAFSSDVTHTCIDCDQWARLMEIKEGVRKP